ncbi:hypothetical protein FACS189472_13040 [Alphaproteobacteria bacterium]|nr:hypothetical protein FACS189472_13040 [Alphaproteobacteria bacterium]
MTQLLKEIGDVLKQDPNGVESVRRVLRNSKSTHKEASTRDLNAAYHVPGYKYVRRNGFLTLEKGGDDKQNPSAQPNLDGLQASTNALIADSLKRDPNTKHTDPVLDADENEESDNEELASASQVRHLEQKSIMDARALPQRKSQTSAQRDLRSTDSSLEDQVLSLTRTHAQQVAQKQAEEQAQKYSKSLMHALIVKEEEDRIKEETQKYELKMKEEEHKRELRMREEELKREQKLREERQLEEKEEREKTRQQKPQSMEELIQSLALTHAEQEAREQTQKKAQTLMQRLAQTLYQDSLNKTEESSDEIVDAKIMQFISVIVGQNQSLLEQVLEMKSCIEEMKSSIEEINSRLEYMHEIDVKIDERVDDVVEESE